MESVQSNVGAVGNSDSTNRQIPMFQQLVRRVCGTSSCQLGLNARKPRALRSWVGVAPQHPQLPNHQHQQEPRHFHSATVPQATRRRRWITGERVKARQDTSGVRRLALASQQYLSSDEIEPQLLEGLTSADDLTEPVNLVQDKESATRVLELIKQQVDLAKAQGERVFFACDTEVSHIDVKAVGPVGNGSVTCLSIYSGPDMDYGNGPCIWVDNMDAAEGTLEYFREFLESEEILKVWHNYSFDRHVLFNHGINVRGLGGDTMHMARLWNTARFQRGGYSLEALTEDLLGCRKRPMKELFGVAKLKKDGSEGKEKVMPEVEELQRFPQFRNRWIRYSVYDAESTWFLHKVLQHKLQTTFWYDDNRVSSTNSSNTSNTNLVDGEAAGSRSIHSLYDFYVKYIVPFGECLTDIERKGMYVDKQYLKKVQHMAEQEREQLEQQVLKWAARYCPEASRLNLYSAAQKQQLLFAPYTNPKKKSACLPAERFFDVENTEQIIEPGKTRPLKKRSMAVRGLGLEPVSLTSGGLPAASADVLKVLAGDPDANPPKYGSAYGHFKDHEEGVDACRALRALYEISSISTMINNFILPLQDLADANSRVHCSLNLNTDTGRLSSRKPNLQNQPALDKDRYKIRDAFCAPSGKKLIVADYSQLELRLLAHITQCKGMIEAFKAGGDFHSRTAMGMYDYVAEAIARGEVLLEWDSSTGKNPPVPLLKEKFSNERKKAKILNFSIAYGKTAFGLSKDFNVSRKEAQETLDKWYSDRPEVKQWQENVINTARKFGYTRTLMGRYRRLPDAMLDDKVFANRRAKSHAERAAINTPIQGAAADVVMQAMLLVHKDPRLKAMGWEMVCQIHDEIIVEGPEESAAEAMQIVKDLMENPFEKPLSVALEVDAKMDYSWYKAK